MKNRLTLPATRWWGLEMQHETEIALIPSCQLEKNPPLDTLTQTLTHTIMHTHTHTDCEGLIEWTGKIVIYIFVKNLPNGIIYYVSRNTLSLAF